MKREGMRSDMATSTTVTTDLERKQRVDQMIALARTYRGWTTGQLNAALGRDANRAAAPSGNPKLDLLARIASALDWEVGEVAESVWDERDSACGAGVSSPPEFAALDHLAQEQHRGGLYGEMERTGLEMRRVASTGRERATAANRLAGAYDGLGRYPRVLECVREGLAQASIGGDLRLMLTVNLANTYYTLWNTEEALALSARLIGEAEARASLPAGSATRVRRVGRAFCYAIRGHSERRMLAQCDGRQDTRTRAARAIEDLTTAARLYDELADEFVDAQYVGLASTARGGLLEARVAAGELSAQDAMDEIIESLERAIDVRVCASGAVSNGMPQSSVAQDAMSQDSVSQDSMSQDVTPQDVTPQDVTPQASALQKLVHQGFKPRRSSSQRFTRHGASVQCYTLGGHMLESLGWWSVFGANIALRAGEQGVRAYAESGEDEQAIAICTNKAAEIAEQLDSWPMRERAFTLDWSLRKRSARERSIVDWTLDGDDVRVLVGTMGRFPLFRPTGWQILKHAALVASPLTQSFTPAFTPSFAAFLSPSLTPSIA